MTDPKQSELEARAREWADRVTGLLINRTVRVTRDILQAEVLPLMAAKEEAEVIAAYATVCCGKCGGYVRPPELCRECEWRVIAEALATALRDTKLFGYNDRRLAALAAYEKAKSEGARV